MRQIYPNLEAELVRKGLNKKELSKKVKITYGSICRKFANENEFLFRETLEIKKILGCDIPLEILFEKKILE
ncbi:MAG: hypothetical protein LBF97_06115 [Elusimicrobiota bacterium]|jgi:hypothetical protein|nr:hypothetical protein [Elusimicrobiota bacterium]